MLCRQNAVRFKKLLKREGYDFFAGVPCSLVKELIGVLESDTKSHYVPAVREDQALGMAAGAFMAGKHAVVIMQNSGLGYSLNVMTSLNLIYRIPVLCLVTWRGRGSDAPEHKVMGKACVGLCEAAGLAHGTLGSDSARGFKTALSAAARHLKKDQTPFVLFIPEGIFG